jgi:hypothetical protein
MLRVNAVEGTVCVVCEYGTFTVWQHAAGGTVA